MTFTWTGCNADDVYWLRCLQRQKASYWLLANLRIKNSTYDHCRMGIDIHWQIANKRQRTGKSLWRTFWSQKYTVDIGSDGGVANGAGTLGWKIVSSNNDTVLFQDLGPIDRPAEFDSSTCSKLGGYAAPPLLQATLFGQQALGNLSQVPLLMVHRQHQQWAKCTQACPVEETNATQHILIMLLPSAKRC